jgi:nucleotide-binding universal stress UspA family protein
MKTIVVLTDFSKKAENAAVYALKLAEKIYANIILFHSFEKFQSINMPESGSWVFEEYHITTNECLAELKKLEDHLATHHEPGAFQPQISLYNEMGYDLGSTVQQLIKDKNIDLIIMGTRGDDVISHFFNGSDTNSVLEHATCPVLFIPEKGSFDHLKTIVFANDLKKDYTKAVSSLIEIARMNHSQIIMTHFGEFEKNHHHYLNLIKDKCEYADITFRQLPGQNIREQLIEFASTVKADLIVMIHHQHEQIKNLITSSKSKKMMHHQQVPLLILRG